MDSVADDLAAEYGALAVLTGSLTEDEAWLPTDCAGLAVRDLVLHLLADAQRALVALHTPAPAGTGPDTTAVTYWRSAPGPDDPEWRQTRSLRTIAAAYSLSALKHAYTGTSGAVVHAARHSDASAVVETQGHRLTVADLLDTLVLEATVHHLDLLLHLDREPPAPSPLARTRRTLDGLLGRPCPLGWDDATYIRTATGRREPTPAERTALGLPPGRFSLIP